MARGFPRRKAGEDFHLLAKLAKLGPVRALRGEPILLSGRVSTRVPFGTGAGIGKELARAQKGEFYPAYDPRVFTWLGVWLRALSTCSEGELSLRDGLAEHASAAPAVDAVLLHDILDELGAIRAAREGQQRGPRQRHERFDALRTLRFIHRLRDQLFPSVPLETALREAPFITLEAGDAEHDPAATREALARLEAGDGVAEPAAPQPGSGSSAA